MQYEKCLNILLIFNKLHYKAVLNSSYYVVCRKDFCENELDVPLSVTLFQTFSF